MNFHSLKSALAAITFVGLAHWCMAGATDHETEAIPAQPFSPFAAGENEIDFTTGYFYSPVITKGHRPKMTWEENDVSWGLMLNSPGAPSWLRGNWEFLTNGFGAAVTNGPGCYLTGGRALFRYNFVQPGTAFVPFLQVGGGSLLDDAFHDRKQHMLGGEFEFTVVSDIGLRYFVTKNWVIVAMGDFQHISNAGTRSRNEGANGVGGSLGAGFFY